MRTVEKRRHLAKQVRQDAAEPSVRCVFLRAGACLNASSCLPRTLPNRRKRQRASGGRGAIVTGKEILWRK